MDDSVSRQEAAKILRRTTWRSIKRNKIFYLFLIPALATVGTFSYPAMYGVVMAFQNFTAGGGYFGSEWVGLEHFRTFLRDPNFYNALRNTLLLNFYAIAFGFPAPIIFALLLNEMRGILFKRVTQTITYLPHFISWVIIAGMIYRMFDTHTGSITALIRFFNNGQNIPILRDPSFFRPMVVAFSIWKGLGWNSIIYLAAISGIDPQLYEAATVDGAGRIRKIWNITLPGIMPTIILLLILTAGSIAGDGWFDAVFNLQNPYTVSRASTLGYFTYREGIFFQRFSYATAIGLTQAVVAFTLVFSANALSRKVRGEGAF